MEVRHFCFFEHIWQVNVLVQFYFLALYHKAYWNRVPQFCCDFSCLYNVKDSHPPIVDKELWDAVQLELERRRLFRETHELRPFGRYTDVQPFICKVVCGKCGAVYWRRTWRRNGSKVRVWQCGKRYQKKGEVSCKSGNLYERDLEKAFLMAWNGIVENRESFLLAWEKQRAEGNALEKWRQGR